MWAAIAGAWPLVATAGCGKTAADTTKAAQPVPAFARTVVLAPVSGKVLIRVPTGSDHFARLTGPRAVPLGTVVDTTAGRVRLTSANPRPGTTQVGEFFRGIFRVDQRRAAGGRVDLAIRDTVSRRACGPGAVHGAALSQRLLGVLRGVAKGRFRTTGRFSAATVRGTDWGVRDRCDGTLTVVREGVMVVRDFRLNEDVVVRAGHTYLARAG